MTTPGRIFRTTAGQNWLVGGGKLQFPADFLPLGYRIEEVLVEADLVMNVPAGGMTSEQQTALLSEASCERRLRTTGLGESAIDWCARGKDVVKPAALAQGDGQAVKLYWPIGWADERSVSKHEADPATAFYKGKAVDIYAARPADVLAGLVIVSGTIQLVYVLSPLDEGVVPTSIIKNFVEIIGKETKLPAGRPVDFVIVKNDGSNITEAELGNMQLTVDGKLNLLERARLPQLARLWNRLVAKGTTQQQASAEGEALPNTGAVPFVPLLFAVAPYKATQLPDIESEAVFLYDGTLAPNTARIFYRYIEPQDEVATMKAAAKLGIPVDAGTTIEAKTASKNGIPESAPFKKTHGVMARRVRSRRAA